MTREELNERRFRALGWAELVAFVCECEEENCRRSVLLVPAAFTAFRGAGEPILRPGHVALADAPVIAERAFIARYAAQEGEKVPQG